MQVEASLLLHDALSPEQVVVDELARGLTKGQWRPPKLRQKLEQVGGSWTWCTASWWPSVSGLAAWDILAHCPEYHKGPEYHRTFPILAQPAFCNIFACCDRPDVLSYHCQMLAASSHLSTRAKQLRCDVM